MSFELYLLQVEPIYRSAEYTFIFKSMPRNRERGEPGLAVAHEIYIHIYITTSNVTPGSQEIGKWQAKKEKEEKKTICVGFIERLGF